ncbi:putative efflux pump outer membrane protein [Sphingomonas changbaiensis NBRC 104936]|uniref:Putative efflux pump outer membrane protein n=1 Tax=Sphingomonas changbaiensis NBRC 104936 TaxID=1219043 RepID=A0A0E9MPQ3_9SPHN|nr:efflux transporter outer membrane subunit [Sphingomonas changbaiensis]GAO39401.1 putative efflux pump outer membrane protein [Sphingomonas changbaiensis NBRC 104936]
MKRAVALALIVSLPGCSMIPHYERPAPPVPQSWPVGDAYLRQSEAALPAVTYRDIFRDPRLQRIIEEALVNNRNLRLAAANIAAAREQYRIQRAQILPDIGANATYTEADRGSGAQSGVGGAASGRRTTYSVQGGITAFELDLFGRIRALSEAAQNRYFATEAGARATRLTLVGDIANAWFTYAADKDLLAVGERTVASAQRSVDLTRARLNGGIAPRTDLRQAEQTLEQARADVAQSRTNLAQDANLLQLLVGAPVDPALLPASIAEVENSVAELPAGLDSTILLRRPDVVQAEYNLRAANAEIGAARAELFPRISLTAVLGFASTALSNLFSGGSFNWSISPQASYSIFQGGAAKANVRLTQAQRDAAVAQYESAIQTAFREVSDALARRGTIDEQLRAQRNFFAAAQDNYQLSEARFRGGIDPFLDTLIAQRSYYSAERTLVATRLLKIQNLVQLYRTLGGDSQLDATSDGPVPQTP